MSATATMPSAAWDASGTQRPVRVAVIADMLEEGWPSMDLVADALMDHLPLQNAWNVIPELVRPSLVPVLGRFRVSLRSPLTADRVFNRFWLYRRALARVRPDCDVFHLVDHSYAHLTTALAPRRTIVTCHDIDTFRGFATPEAIDTGLPRFLVNRLIRGMRRAALIVCPSHATARELAAARLVDPARVAVVPNGVELPARTDQAQEEARRLLSTADRTVDVLHVGSVVPRKRLDLVLEIVARSAARDPRVRLVRVGPPLTSAQAAQARRLGVSARILTLPFLSRPTLFEVYRRTAVLLVTSDREGFGLPVIEALSTGLPVVARDLPVLREVGGEAPVYLQDDPQAWAETVAQIIAGRDDDAWQDRREAGCRWATQFSWRRYASEMALLYAQIAGRGNDRRTQGAPSARVSSAIPATGAPPGRPATTDAKVSVLHVGKYYPPVPGGMERVLQLLCEREREQVDVRVLVTGASRRTERTVLNGVPITRAASLGAVGSVALSPALPLELWRNDADLTVIHEPNPPALVADAVTRRRGPLLVYFHSEVVRPQWRYQFAYRPFLERVLDRAARVIVASPAMAAARQLEGYAAKCVVIPYGIEAARLIPTPAITTRVAEIRQRFAGLPLVLFVGRLVPYKGVDVLIRAMRAIQAHLCIIGDGPLRAALRTLTESLGLANRVEFLGAVPDEQLIALYHACDMLVLPSVTRAEAFGMVQLEAMACGKPVISTDLPSGVPWVNLDGQTGLVVPPANVDALAEALSTLVRDERLRARLGAAGERRVELEFTACRMAERTVSLYRAVLNERSS